MKYSVSLLFVTVFRLSQGQCIYTDQCVSAIDKGRYYRGHISTTDKGDACLDWTSHTYDVTPEKYPQEGLDRNFCRNPLGSGLKPWCYTKNNSTTDDYWGFCHITPCDPCYFRGIQFKQEDAFHDGCSQCICLADGFRCYRCPHDASPANGTEYACYVKENPKAKYPACCKRTVCHGRDADFNFKEFTDYLKHKLNI